VRATSVVLPVSGDLANASVSAGPLVHLSNLPAFNDQAVDQGAVRAQGLQLHHGEAIPSGSQTSGRRLPGAAARPQMRLGA
jgi:hypothetical protein